MAKRALIIGVDAYPNAKDSENGSIIKDLKGCVNDAKLMRELLVEKFLVPAGNVSFLSSPPPPDRPGDEATRARILAGFDQLIEETESDDMVVVYFAGHGSRVKDRDLDEGSGMDSTIVPADAIRWSNKNQFPEEDIRDITDDIVHVKLLRLAEKTPNVTLIFDSCHSGTMHRGPGDEDMQARQAPDDDRPFADDDPDPLSPADRAFLAERSNGKSSSGWAAPVGYTMISGCRDAEYSYETTIQPRGPNEEPRKHGALTYHLTQALWNLKPGQTYRDVFDVVAPQVMANNANQNPQIHGAKDREVFGTTEIAPLSFVGVSDVQGTKVTLSGGNVHGLMPGSVWSIVPKGSRAVTADTRVCDIKVTDVRSADAFAEVVPDTLQDPTRLEPGTWAVEKARDFGDRRMAVRVVGERATSPEAWDAVQEQLGQFEGTINVVTGSERAVRLVLVPKRDEVPAGDPVPQLRVTDEPMLAAVDESGELMVEPAPASPESARELVENLDRWANYRYKLAIDNPGSPLSSDVSIEIRTDVTDADGTTRWVLAEAAESDTLPVLQAGRDRMEIRLINRGSEDIFFGLMDFTINGAVDLLNENGPKKLRGGTPDDPFVLMLGPTPPLTWEGGFPFDPNPFADSPREGVEILKVFLTQKETSFERLKQGPSTGMTTRGTRGGDNPLQALLDSPGSGTRGVQLTPVDSWGTVSFSFILKAPDAVEVGPNATAELGGVKIKASGAGGRVRLGGGVEQDGIERPPTFPGDSPAARLRAMLMEEGWRPAQSFTVGQAAGGTRGGGGDSDLEFDCPGVGPGFGELALSADDAGFVRWHLPVSPDGDTAERGDIESRGDAASRVRYRVSVPEVDDASPVGTRGPIASTLGKLFVERIAYPMLDPVVGAALGLWESKLRPNRIRWFGPDDFEEKGERTVDAEGWRRLSEDRALLFLHGPFSRAHKGFRDLDEAFMGSLSAAYGGRVIAFDHMTLSEDPLQNVQWLLEQLPSETKLELDIVAHSRGGLVGRALAERGSEFAVDGRSVKVRRMVMAGSPSDGTELANFEHVETLLNVFTNLLMKFDPTEVVGPIFQLAQKLATGVVSGLPGVEAMTPGSDFLGKLPGPAGTGSEYYAIASDIRKAGSDKFTRRMFDRLVSNVLGREANDLLVPAASIMGTESELPLADRKTLLGADARAHLRYFSVPSVQRQVAEWLGRDGAPVVWRTPPEEDAAPEDTTTPDAPAASEDTAVPAEAAASSERAEGPPEEPTAPPPPTRPRQPGPQPTAVLPGRGAVRARRSGPPPLPGGLRPEPPPLPGRLGGLPNPPGADRVDD